MAFFAIWYDETFNKSSRKIGWCWATTLVRTSLLSLVRELSVYRQVHGAGIRVGCSLSTWEMQTMGAVKVESGTLGLLNTFWLVRFLESNMHFFTSKCSYSLQMCAVFGVFSDYNYGRKSWPFSLFGMMKHFNKSARKIGWCWAKTLAETSLACQGLGVHSRASPSFVSCCLVSHLRTTK